MDIDRRGLLKATCWVLSAAPSWEGPTVHG